MAFVNGKHPCGLRVTGHFQVMLNSLSFNPLIAKFLWIFLLFRTKEILCHCDVNIWLFLVNLVPRVSFLCLPWSLEERPWLRLVT